LRLACRRSDALISRLVALTNGLFNADNDDDEDAQLHASVRMAYSSADVWDA